MALGFTSPSLGLAKSLRCVMLLGISVRQFSSSYDIRNTWSQGCHKRFKWKFTDYLSSTPTFPLGDNRLSRESLADWNFAPRPSILVLRRIYYYVFSFCPTCSSHCHSAWLLKRFQDERLSEEAVSARGFAWLWKGTVLIFKPYCWLKYLGTSQ